MKREVLFIQGPEKTGTSTITGILNCHPDIFILFENYLAQTNITKYGNQLLERYPEARQFFRKEEDYGVPVNELFSYLEAKEPSFSYKYVGTKINSLDPGITQKINNHKIIFMKRDVKSWLLKESIIDMYRTDLDVVRPAVDYLKYIILSSRYHHAYHLWLEDMIMHNDEIIKDLASYLNVDLENHTKQWWDKIAAREPDDPKSMFKLDHVHHSSRLKPDGLDTKYETIDHPFWAITDQVFNKYFRKKNYITLWAKMG